MRKRCVVQGIMLLLVVGALTQTPVEAVTCLRGGTAWTVPWDVGGVAGIVVNLIEPWGGDGAVVEGYYGHTGESHTCQGSDGQLSTNYLLLHMMHEETDPTSIVIVASVSMSDIRSSQHTVDYDCEVGPPTWTATGVVSASRAAEGLAGCDDDAAQTFDNFSHTSFETKWDHNKDTQPPLPQLQDQGAPSFLQWEYDENDPSTHSINVSTKIKAMFLGTGIEIIVVECDFQARVTLEASLG